MTRIHRILAALVPPPRREWIRAHAAELEHVRGRSQRRRWAIGLLTLTGAALVSQLKKDPQTFLGGTIVKSIVVTLSIINLVAGVSLAALYVIETDAPSLVLALSAGLVIQGSYTLAMILGAFHSRHAVARQLQLVGSTVALMIGFTAFVVWFLANVGPVNGDPEYAPMTIALVIAGHGFASLLTFAPQRPAEVETAT